MSQSNHPTRVSWSYPLPQQILPQFPAASSVKVASRAVCMAFSVRSRVLALFQDVEQLGTDH